MRLAGKTVLITGGTRRHWMRQLQNSGMGYWPFMQM
jgi:hypothetical protein